MPEFNNLREDAPHIDTVVLDDQTTAAGGLDAYRAARAVGATAAVGPQRSVQATRVGTVASSDDFPLVSFWASDPALSDSTVFSTFSRVFPSDIGPPRLVCRWIVSQGWQFISVIYENDPFALGYLRAIENEAHAQGLSVTTSVSYNGQSSESARRAVDRVADPVRGRASNIILLVGFDGMVASIAERAHERGLLSDQHVWLVCDTPSPRGAASALQAAEPPLDPALLVGVRALYFSPALQPGYLRSEQVWSTLRVDDCARAGISVPAASFAERPPLLFRFAYDAAASLVIAMKTRAHPGANQSAAELLRVLRSSDFDGASGPVTFMATGNDANSMSGPGDRQIASMDLIVHQWVLINSSDGRVTLGLERLEALNEASDEARDVSGGVPRVWLGGRTGAVGPRDAILLEYQRLQEQQRAQQQLNRTLTLVVSCVVGFLVPGALLFCGYLCIKRRRQVAQMAAAYQLQLEAKLDAAISSTAEFEHAAVLISAHEFVRLGRLIGHEELYKTAKLELARTQGGPLCSSSALKSVGRSCAHGLSDHDPLPSTFTQARPRRTHHARQARRAHACAASHHLLQSPVDVPDAAGSHGRAV